MAIPGSVVGVGKLVTPGGAQGPLGGMGPPGPTVVSADAGNIAVLGSDNLILVPQSTIWSQRLRSYNAIGNPNFEVDQRYVGQGVVNPATWTLVMDRWMYGGSGTYGQHILQGSGGSLVPGTTFQISSKFLVATLQTAQATLGSGDFLLFQQQVEGPNLRELLLDVHSISLMVYSSVANLKFSVFLKDTNSTHTFVHLCTVPVADTWTLVTIPNIPIWTAGATWSTNPGVNGYNIGVTLACGTTYLSPTADSWQNGNFFGASGMSNWAASPVNSQFYIAFVQHEPGPICTQLTDKPFSQNLDECLRHYQKTYVAPTKPGTANALSGMRTMWQIPASTSFFTPVSFVKVMAKSPTLTIWDPISGQINAYAYAGGGPIGVTTALYTGDSGYGGFQSAGAPGANIYAFWHHTADTGW